MSTTNTAVTSVADPAVPSVPLTPRMENVTVCLPLIRGSVAFYLGKKADEFQTHRWTLYLRGPNNEDLSQVISKVVFQLHPSFAEPTREQTAPPYEVTETGWGEFEAQIKVHWKDPSENPVMFSHAIKLYPPGTVATTIPVETDTPVVWESYDEVVFTDPTESFYKQLERLASLPSVEYSQQAHFQQFSDTEDAQALLEAQKFLQKELGTVKERLGLLDTDMGAVEEAMRAIHEKRASKARAAATAASPSAASKKQKT
ncbi:hypothetical protein MPSEU_000711100 [Mayamaea pseudoterrestris]|nr:hypothetical protein MPSEU_000711100 [Mayamaea pseudoterrestris]